MSAWMQLHSGRPWYFESPRPEDVDISDVAHALSHLCRFGGHTTRFYSVAEHSVLVARLLADRGHSEMVRAGLLHDATEAYVVDVPRPLKRLLPEYTEYETRAYHALSVALKFGITPAVEAADGWALHIERAQLLVPSAYPHMDRDWGMGRQKLAATPGFVWQLGWPPEKAKDEFLKLYEELTK